MAHQRHQRYSGRHAPKPTDSREPEPARLTDIRVIVDSPPRVVCHLRRTISKPVPTTERSRDGPEFIAVNMHRCPREISESTSVVEIQMRDEDVANITARIAEFLDLLSDRPIQHRVRLLDQPMAHPAIRLYGRALPVAGIDEQQSALMLDQQAMRDHPRRPKDPWSAVDEPAAEWPRPPAIEMMHPHLRSPLHHDGHHRTPDGRRLQTDRVDTSGHLLLNAARSTFDASEGAGGYNTNWLPQYPAINAILRRIDRSETPTRTDMFP